MVGASDHSGYRGGARLNGAALLVASLAMVLASCSAPSTAPGTAPQSGGTSSGPKTLRIAFKEEPDTVYGGSGADAREHGDLFNAGLTFFDANGNLLPKLAVKVPSVADGDWKALPDGSMEVTWQLKPNLKWQDGAPVTSEDFAFSMRVFRDPASPRSVPRAVRFIGEALTPDPQTLVLRYPQVFNGAAVAGSPEFPPVPRHLLQDLYALAGAEGLANSPIWTTQWVGLGPFRMTSRTFGSQIEAAAFDDFVFGRPRVDRLIVRYILDVNTLAANLLAGDIDMAPVGSLEAAQAADLKRQWESSGGGTVGVVKNRLRQMQLQFRDPTLPWASDVRVRQAMAHLIERQALVDTIIHGLSTVGDLALMQTGPVYARLEQRGIPRYPFDRAQGERLLDAAGWPRGSDGVRRNAAGTVLIHNPAVVGESDLAEGLVIVDGFRAGGITSDPDIVPDNATNVEERRGISHSVMRSASLDDSYWDRFLTSLISSPQTRWRGANTGGYSNPSFERLFDSWRVSLDPDGRTEREADLHKQLLDDVAYIPLFYNVDVFAHRRSLVGPKPFAGLGRNTTIDVHTWTLE